MIIRLNGVIGIPNFGQPEPGHTYTLESVPFPRARPSKRSPEGLQPSTRGLTLLYGNRPGGNAALAEAMQSCEERREFPIPVIVGLKFTERAGSAPYYRLVDLPRHKVLNLGRIDPALRTKATEILIAASRKEKVPYPVPTSGEYPVSLLLEILRYRPHLVDALQKHPTFRHLDLILFPFLANNIKSTRGTFFYRDAVTEVVSPQYPDMHIELPKSLRSR